MSFIPTSCIPVIGSVVVDGGTVTVVPAGGFAPVAESRWFDTDSQDLSLLGLTDLTLTSPIPAAGQIVVVTDLSYFIELAVALALTSIDVVVRQVSDLTVLWTASIGFAATATAGTTGSFGQSDLYVYGGVGEQLELVVTLAVGLGVTASVSANFGGYIATP